MVTRTSPPRRGSPAPPPPRDLAALQIPAFLGMLPAPGRLTLDLKCGTGIVGRLLSRQGHTVIGTESDPAAAAAALAGGDYRDVLTASPPAIPLPHAAIDLVVAWMAFDFADDLDAAIDEAARVLAPGGAIALAVLHGFTHPVWRPGQRVSHALTTVRHGNRWAVVRTSSLPPEAYLEALERAGLTVGAVADPCPPGQLPRFLHATAVKPATRAPRRQRRRAHSTPAYAAPLAVHASSPPRASPASSTSTGPTSPAGPLASGSLPSSCPSSTSSAARGSSSDRRGAPLR